MADETTRARLKQAVANLESLPAMPVIAQKLLSLQLDTDEGERQMLNLIGQDPQIYAKIVGMANSPMMGLSRKISSVQEAALVLGLTRVKAVAMGIASLSVANKLKPGKYFNPQDLWLHSMTTAMVMRTIAQSIPRKFRPSEDQIFMAGLLHDIGFMALHHLDPAASDELHYQISQQTDRPVLDVELETLGLTHCYIGSQLAVHWHLPAEIIAVTRFHHPPYVVEVSGENPLVSLVSIAEKLVPDFGIAEGTACPVDDEEWEGLGIDLDSVEDIRNQADELAVQAAQMAGM